MPSRRLLMIMTAGVVLACRGASTAQTSPAPMTEEQKTFYAMGVMVGRSVTPMKLTPEEIALVTRGMADAAAGKKEEVDLEAYGPKVQQLAAQRAQVGAEGEKAKGKAFEEAAAAEGGAVRTPSGLVFRTIRAGTGSSPAATDTVSVHYRGTLVGGKEFDSSIKRGQPAEFPLNGVIPCWTEGVQRMKVGEKAQLVCPATIAYGERGRPGIPGGATLVFEVELLGVADRK